MAECGVCGMESETLYKCKSCGEPFCSNECGSIAEKLCLFCMDDDEDYETEEYEVHEDDDDW
jgi:hypothetical protein